MELVPAYYTKKIIFLPNLSTFLTSELLVIIFVFWTFSLSSPSSNAPLQALLSLTNSQKRLKQIISVKHLSSASWSHCPWQYFQHYDKQQEAYQRILVQSYLDQKIITEKETLPRLCAFPYRLTVETEPTTLIFSFLKVHQTLSLGSWSKAFSKSANRSAVSSWLRSFPITVSMV